MKPYHAIYEVGSSVRIADRSYLQEFQRTWEYHHKLLDEQLEYAGNAATIEKRGFYHGGDVIYVLAGLPGWWHEDCLRHP